MSEFKATVRAPSNIAVIKYMGKSDAALNLPVNSSLSLTLRDLTTWVRVEGDPAVVPALQLEALETGVAGPRFFPGALAGKARALAFFDRAVPSLARILEEHGMGFRPAALKCSTGNTFPAGAGIASSASSFAALTLAWALGLARNRERFAEEFGNDGSAGGLREALARLSRQGSGSSCRSFFGPWTEWRGEEVGPVASRLEPLADLVLLVDSTAKSVSSSEAHARVKTSGLFAGRAERANRRFAMLRTALAAGDFAALTEIGWADSMEMHALFHTASPPFSYWTPETVRILRVLMTEKPHACSTPTVTLDAGANVHLLIPAREAPALRAWLQERFPNTPLLVDGSGSGACIDELSSGTSA